MADVWREFRASPSTFLTNQRTNVSNVTRELLEILSSEETNDSLKFNVLEILQENCALLFENFHKLEAGLNSLKSTFESLRHSSDQSLLSQILVTITVMLIGTDYIENLQQYLVEFISLLLEITLKVKTEANKLMRAVACECLKELELTIPGLLCDVVGSFYGCSVTETSFIHQHYMALFATVLAHCVQKLALIFNDENSHLAEDSRHLEDLLFSSGSTTFEPPQKYLKTAQRVSMMTMGQAVIPAEIDQSVLKKAVTHLVDHVHLFTSNYKVLVILELIKIIKHSTLAPVMLKSLLLRYVSSSDVQLFNIVLLMKLDFEGDICDDRDKETLFRRLLITAVHPSLEREWSSLVMQWLTQFYKHNHTITESVPDEVVVVTGTESGTSSLLPSYAPLFLHVFDSPDMCWYKLQALQEIKNESLIGHDYLRGYIDALQKPVLYGIVGPSSQLFYRTIVMCSDNLNLREDVERAVVDSLIAHPEFTEHTIDTLEAVEQAINNKSLTQTVVSQMCQWLQSLDITTLSSQLLKHLLLLETAARGNIIKQRIPLNILHRIVYNSTVCSEGLWSHGNALLRVCYSLMQSRPDATISKSLVNLLIEIAKNYNELDIRDRAKFYSQILLCVSSEKLQLLLSSSDGKNSDLSQVVVARISDNVYPLPSPVKVIPSPMLVLNRIHSQTESICKHIFTPTNDTQGELLSYYQSWLRNDTTVLGLDIPCNISISSERPDWVSDTIYAVVMQFKAKGNCRKPEDIQITTLTADDQNVVKKIELFPMKPYPVTLDISTTFMLEDSATCVSTLHPLNISFQDFFHIVPVNGSSRKSQLFTGLWNNIEANQYNSNNQDGRGALSVCSIQDRNDVILEAIRTQLAKFCIDYKEGLNESYKVLIFLPPFYHFLMKLTLDEKCTVFHIATDLWSLLPFINKWIKSI